MVSCRFSSLCLAFVSAVLSPPVFADDAESALSLHYQIPLDGGHTGWFRVEGHEGGKPFVLLHGEPFFCPIRSQARLRGVPPDLALFTFHPPRALAMLGSRGRPSDRASIFFEPVVTEALEWMRDRSTEPGEAERRLVLSGTFFDGQLTRQVPFALPNARDSLRSAFFPSGAPFPDSIEGLPVLLLWDLESGLVDLRGQFGEEQPLADALLANDEARVRLLLDAGVNPNRPGVGRYAPTHLAATLHNAAALALLAHRRADHNLRDGENWTPLHYAAARSNLAAVQVLLDRGSRRSARNRAGENALSLAVEGSLPEVVATLIEAGVPLTLPSTACPTIRMINLRRDDLAGLFAAAGARPRLSRTTDRMVLAGLVREDRLELVRFFVEHLGFDLTALPGESSPFALAAGGALEDTLDYLLAKGVPLPRGGEGGEDLLHLAARSNPTAVRWFIAQGFDPNEIDSAGRSPLEIALVSGNAEGVTALLEAGVDPNRAGRGGVLPLRHAIHTGQSAVVSALLDGGARIDLLGEAFGALIEDVLQHDLAVVWEAFKTEETRTLPILIGDFPLWGVAQRMKAANLLEKLEVDLADEDREELVLMAPSQIPTFNATPMAAPLPSFTRQQQRRYGEQNLAVDVVIDRAGHVRFPILVQSPQAHALREPVLRSLREWRFPPPDLPDGVHALRVGLPIRLSAVEDERTFGFNEVDRIPEVLGWLERVRLPLPFARQPFQAEVTVHYLVGKDGRVAREDIYFEREVHPAISEAIRDAVSRWRFRPALYRGEPVECRVATPLNFGARR